MPVPEKAQPRTWHTEQKMIRIFHHMSRAAFLALSPFGHPNMLRLREASSEALSCAAGVCSD